MCGKDVTVYSQGSKILHWIIAVLVILMLAVSFFLEDVPETYIGTAYMLHKSLGLTVLALMLIRLYWIVRFGKPPLPTSAPAWERILSRAVQWSFYVLLIIQPISGWVLSAAADRMPTFFGLFKVPTLGIAPNESLDHVSKFVHEKIAWLLVFLVFLHLCGALKHHFINKDGVLRRMLPHDKNDTHPTLH